ncbi:MAG TPA: hypothetical protein VD706_01565 [Candidatus Saccharimonadales bacterium]|nr:hypothetical protein [Candidatus Saccharimonadales bacterium]
MKNLGQKGFTLIEGLLIIIALSLIAGVGYYVYNANKEADKNLTSSASKEEKPAAKEKTQKNYLEIKELGIKFELTSKLKNAYYAKVDGGYFLSVHDIDNNPELGGCKAGGAENDRGLLSVVSGKVGEPNTTTASEAPWTQSQLDSSGFKKVGDTYYGFMHGQAPCYDPTAANEDKYGALVDGYMKAFVNQQATIQKL